MNKFIVSSALSVLFITFISSTVLASTVIGTDINTAGNLTVSGLSAVGNDTGFDIGGDEAGLSIGHKLTGPGTFGYGAFTRLRYDPSTDVDFSIPTGLEVDVNTLSSNTHSFAGTILQGIYANVTTQATSPVDEIDTLIVQARNGSAGTTGTVIGTYNLLANFGGGTITNAYGDYVKLDSNNGTITNNFAYYVKDTSAISGITNNYSFWTDTPGVFRIKNDNTFNSLYQAIPALYNPQFTKYTPGAANYERVVMGQWSSNTAQIGTEAGGTGVLRSLQLIGKNVGVGTSTPIADFQVATTTANATTSIEFGKANQNKGSCLKLYRTDGTAVYAYIGAGTTALTISTTACTNISNF